MKGGDAIMSTKKKSSPYLSVDSYISDSRSRSDSESSQRCESETSITITLNQLSINVDEEFTILKTISEGTYSKILLGKEKASKGDKMVLKAINNETTTAEDFNREMYTNYYLSPHPNIVTSYNVSFHWEKNFVYVMEYAHFGDLSRYMRKNGQLNEAQMKSVASQLCSALEFIHGLNMVHQDVILENILVFKKDLSLIKLCDFASTRPQQTHVTKMKQDWIPFLPPEICTILHQEKYYASSSIDVWQTGIILISCLTGNVPWRCADILTDTDFAQYNEWRKRRCIKVPECFVSFSSRLVRLLKRVLEPKPSKRCKVQEIKKYLNDEWIIKGIVTASSNKSSLDRKESNYNNAQVNSASSRCSQRRRSIRPQSASLQCQASKRRSTARSIRCSPSSDNKNNVDLNEKSTEKS